MLRELNDFESSQEHNNILLTWLHISSDEQLRRFKEREEIPWKNYRSFWRLAQQRKWPAYGKPPMRCSSGQVRNTRRGIYSAEDKNVRG
ncbi:MAG: hypothetical protein ACLT2T_04560 [Bilophila wadsworthia]